jgi:hypothetical protein
MHRDICVTNPEPIVAWVDAFIRELYEMRKTLTNEDGPDVEAVQEMFEEASTARAKLMAGLVNSRAREASSAEIPSFSEGMGEMFAGRKVMERMSQFTRGKGRNRD